MTEPLHPLALPLKEVSTLTGIKYRHLLRLIHAGTLAATRPGGGRLFYVLHADVVKLFGAA